MPRYILKKKNYLLITFLLALGAAALLFVPYIIFDGGVFYYYGDFNVQEIPFYQLIHGMVRSGEMGWNHLTDLGTDTLSSYSFYLLGSPFFWLTIPFPNEFVPYLIGPLLILKFACAASAAYFYLKRYVEYKPFAVLGGLLYAFSGFSIYNVFFFHFHEPMIMLPLLLTALDLFLYEKRRGVFAVAVFAACVVNYYFFVGQALFVLMYFLMVTLTKTYRFRIGEFLLLAAETVIGLCGTAFILLPSVLGLLGNPRLDSYPHGWEALVHAKPQRYFLTVLAFLFPADMPAMPTFTPESNCKWASVAGWLPLFGMTGAIAYLQLRSRDWLKKLIFLLCFFAFIPALNSMFQLFNFSIYYARWYYMPVLMFVLATVRALEDSEADWGRALRWSVGLTVGASALIAFMPSLTDNDDGEEVFSLGVEADPKRFGIYVLIAMLSLLALTLVMKKFRGSREGFFRAATAAMLGVSFLSSFFIIGTGTLGSGTLDEIRTDILNARDRVEIDDLEQVRSDFYECVDNTSMFWKVQSINCFQSSVSTSIMNFYEHMNITRDVASRPNFSAYGLRSLFSCKYYFDYTRDNGDKTSDECFLDELGNTKMPCWKYVKTTSNHFDVYENECYIPMGFCFDSYITEEEFDRVSSSNKTEATLYALVLTREQMEKYSEITGYDAEKYALLYSAKPNAFRSRVDSYVYGPAAFSKQCEKLKKRACDRFGYTSDGFEAHFDNIGDDTLMFFSIPYSSGWSATINGAPVEIEKADFGFMAIPIPANKNCEIRFTYRTPGFVTGTAISLAAAVMFAVYMVSLLLFRLINRKKRLARQANAPREDLE